MLDYSEKVEAYSRLVGLLPPAPQAARVEEYLGMAPDDLGPLGPEDLARIALDINSFAVRVQAEVNRTALKVAKCRYEIHRRVEGKLGKYRDAFKTEDKRLAAALDDPVAADYLAMQVNCEAFVTRWEGHVGRLDAFVKSIADMRYSKGK